jgi:hypothetical protein
LDCTISATRTQKLLLTDEQAVYSPWRLAYRPLRHLFGTDSQEAYRQALWGLSWLSYSRGLFRPTRACQARHGRSLYSWLPTPAHVERTCEGPNPVGGFVDSPLTNFVHDGSSENTRQSFSASPAFDWPPRGQPRTIHRIESEDYSSGKQNQPDYFQKPPSLGTNESPRMPRYSTNT